MDRGAAGAKPGGLRGELEAIFRRMWREDHGGRDVPIPPHILEAAVQVMVDGMRLHGTEQEAAALRGLGAEPLRAKVRRDIEPLVRRACVGARPS